MYSSNPKKKKKKKGKKARKSTARRRKLTVVRLKTKLRGKKRRNLAKRLSARKYAKRRGIVYKNNKRRSRRRRRYAANRRQTAAQRRASLRNLRKARAAQRRGYKANPRRRRKYRRNQLLTQAAANPRRRRRYRRNALTQAAANPRRRRRRGGALKRYTRNFGLGRITSTLKGAVKVGVLAAVGVVAHRVTTKLIDENLLARVDLFNSPTVAPWRRTIASVIAMAAGAPVAGMIAPAFAATIAGGMAVSFAMMGLVKLFEAIGQPQIAGYFAGYADASGRAYSGSLGSYYTYQPGETFNGYGEYFEPMSGFGQAPMLSQAAAGYGQPMLSQAAAGTGEFIAQGAEGIGEYDIVPYGSHNSPHLELMPNLSEAEQAMTAAEAVAGYGDLPGRMTVEPTMYTQGVPDEPGGSRAGIMAGRDGIFG